MSIYDHICYCKQLFLIYVQYMDKQTNIIALNSISKSASFDYELLTLDLSYSLSRSFW